MSPERRRLTYALLLSLLMHTLLLSLTFGGRGLWLPGFGFPWQDRRIDVPDLRVVVGPVPEGNRRTEANPRKDAATSAAPAKMPFDQKTGERAGALVTLDPSAREGRRQAEQLEVARQDAARQEAALAENARLKAERVKAARVEAARAEAARIEGGRVEAARAEAARAEAARAEAARAEAARGGPAVLMGQ